MTEQQRDEITIRDWLSGEYLLLAREGKALNVSVSILGPRGGENGRIVVYLSDLRNALREIGVMESDSER